MYALDKRPRKLNEVIGQEVNIRDFKNRSKEIAFPQVMMLSGSTGTGKSTSGHIIASLINCHSPIEDDNGFKEPCCECPACKDVISEQFGRDVLYRDASKMGKDDVIKLESLAMDGAFMDSKRIIIIEEAQELASKGAKGALLKLIEKPRKDVHFILLTMDITQFDKSIRDRCQVYNFKPVDRNTISEYLYNMTSIVDPDGKLPETIDDVIFLIGDNCGGSVRKALQDFERCISSEIYTETEALECLGYMSEDESFKSLILLLNKDDNFFTGLNKNTLFDFFNYTYAILLNVAEGQITGDYGSPYTKQRASSVIESGRLKDLLELYKSIQIDLVAYYNKPNCIRQHFISFFNKQERKVRQLVDPVDTRKERGRR